MNKRLTSIDYLIKSLEYAILALKQLEVKQNHQREKVLPSEKTTKWQSFDPESIKIKK